MPHKLKKECLLLDCYYANQISYINDYTTEQESDFSMSRRYRRYKRHIRYRYPPLFTMVFWLLLLIAIMRFIGS